jgi:hypothetical protein
MRFNAWRTTNDIGSSSTSTATQQRDVCAGSPGRRLNSAIGMARVVLFASIVSTCASSARIATAVLDGFTAMHWSLAPNMPWIRLNPPSAAQPEPGSRLLHRFVTS